MDEKQSCIGCKFLIREEKKELFEAKIRKKHKPYNEYPLRLCYSMHDCEICKKTILCGEYYYDGGFGRRVHQDCVDEPKVDKGKMKKKTLDWKIWMTDDQFECYKMLSDLFGGEHHICGSVKPFGEGIEHNTSQDFSTYDFNYMTRAVVMAHDRMIRFSILPSGPGRIRLVFHKRYSRDGDTYSRHPTIEEAIKNIRTSIK